MTEAEGTEIMTARFAARGFAIDHDVPFDLGGRRLRLDGFDPARRVGFEFVTHEEGDHKDLPSEVLDALEAEMVAGHLWLLIIDEALELGTDELAWACDRFCDAVAAAQPVGAR
jgi:hypothetical protein